jgi:hypothetical protein
MFKKGEILLVKSDVCQTIHHREGHGYADRLKQLLRERPEEALRYAEVGMVEGPRSLPRRLCRIMIEKGHLEIARSIGRKLIRNGFRGDGNTVLAEVADAQDDQRAVIRYARRAIEFAEPNTNDPLDHIVTPRALLAQALVLLGRTEEALSPAREVLEVQPDHPRMEPFKQVLMAREPMRALLWAR